VRILIVYETVYPDFIGGIEHRNYALALALGRRGHEVTLAGFLNAPLADPPGVRVLSLGELGAIGGLYNREGKRSTRQALRFARRVARLDLGAYDLVETPQVPFVHLFPLAMRARRAGKPLLVTWYEYWGAYWKGYVGSAKAPAYRAIEWAAAHLGDEVTATSRLTAERLAAARGRRDVEIVPCGIEVSTVARAAATFQGAGPPLIYTGRLLEHKRLDLLIRALSRLGMDRPGALLTLFGEGPDRPRLERLAAEQGVADRIVFRGHVESSEEVWREMGGARLAVQPSAREGFGLFPLEAMAAGLPVVYCESTESAVGELVRDGREGIQSPADPEALAAILARLLDDDEERQRLANAARARAAEFDWDEIARRIEEIGAELIGRRP
jgi:glycosyltransferase involved in cell wall biosynthesis